MAQSINRRDALLLGAAGLSASGCAATQSAVSSAAAPPSAALAPFDPFVGPEIEEILRRLDAGPGLASGGPGDLELAAHVGGKLGAAGFAVERQPIAAPAFELRKAAVIHGAGSTEITPQAVVVQTPAEGVAAPLRLWRDETDAAAVKGAIAVVILPFARHSRIGAAAIKSRLDGVVAAGAVAVVLVTDGPTGETILLNTEPARPPARVPVAVVGPARAGALIAQARAGAAGRFVVDGTNTTRDTLNVIGRLTGRAPGSSDGVVVVSTPRTGWLRCVAERGPGLAIFLTLARWAPRAFPKRDLVFVAAGAHEYENAGSGAFLASNAPDPAKTALWVHLGAGFAARDFHEAGGYELRPLPSVDPQRYLVGSDACLAVLRRAFAGQPGLEAAYSPAAGSAGELTGILARGYPRAFGMYASHRFHHTSGDRLDKTDPEFIRTVGRSVARAMAEILAA